MEITGHDSHGSTNKRQHETMFTVWFITTKSGLLFKTEDAAKTYALMHNPCVSIVPPLYY